MVKKFIQQGHSPFDARSVLPVREHGKRARTPLVAFFNIPNLVNKKADLSWDMAIRLSKAFGSTPEGWMRIQFQYDAAKVEERAKKIRVKPFEGEALLA